MREVCELRKYPKVSGEKYAEANDKFGNVTSDSCKQKEKVLVRCYKDDSYHCNLINLRNVSMARRKFLCLMIWQIPIESNSRINLVGLQEYKQYNYH